MPAQFSDDKAKLFSTAMAVLSTQTDSAVASAPKRRRNPPGNPDPAAEVVALSPRTLLATNRYICEVCHKGFQRDQNLQLHRRGHNLPWKLKQRASGELRKRVYVCPEPGCAHHDPIRALGDLTGIKKHFSRKHGEKKWKCDKCSKRYAVQSDWKAHTKVCGTKEYRCDCGTIFSRKDSFVTHRAFCDALTEENYITDHNLAAMVGTLYNQTEGMFSHTMPCLSSSTSTMSADSALNSGMIFNNGGACLTAPPSFMSATALLQRAAGMGAKVSDEPALSSMALKARFRNGVMGSDEEEGAFHYGGIQSSDDMSSKTGFAPFMFGGESKLRNQMMTQDFLGLGASASVVSRGSENGSYFEDGGYCYHQTAFQKHIW